MLKKLFGLRLKFLRKIKMLTQEQLALAIGVTKQHLGRIERGLSSPSFEALEKICEHLEAPPASLFMFAESEAGQGPSKQRGSNEAINPEKGFASSLTVPGWGTWTIDLNTGSQAWSRALNRFLGFSQKHKPSLTTFKKFIHPEDLQIFDDFYQKSAAGLAASHISFRIVRKSGISRYIRAQSDMVTDEEAENLVVCMTFLDITELREFWNHLLHNQEQLEQAIHEKTRSLSRSVQEKEAELERRKLAERTSEYYQKMVESSSDAMAFVDKNFYYRAANPSAGHVWGVSSQEMQGSKVPDIIGQELFAKTIRPRLEQVLKGEELRIQSWFDLASGERRFFDVFYTPHYEQGEVTGVVATARDQTENISLQRDLEIYKHAVQASLAAIAIMDRKGVLTHVNPAFVRLWGYNSAEEIIGRKLSSFCQSPRNGQDILKQMFKGQTQEGWLNIRGKDNRILTVKFLSSQLVDHAGELQGITASFWDETERINAENQVKQSEATYRGLFEAAAEGLIINDDQAYILEANNTALSFFGYTREEFIGLRGPELIDAEDLKDKPFGLQHLVAGETIRMERVFVRKDGSRFTADLSARSFPGGRFIVCLHDISERKKMEMELEKSRAIMIEAEKLSGLGSWELDIQNDVCILSPNWLRIHGTSHSHLKTSELMKIAHPDDVRDIEDSLSRAIAHGEPYQIEHRIIRQDTGEVRDILAYGEVKLDDKGKARKMYGAALDITERKQTEEALRWSESRLRALFESSSEGLILHDLEGNILEANQTALNMFGYTLEELKELHTRDLVHPQEACQVDKEFEVYQHKEYFAVEHRCLRKDGTEIRVNVKGKLVTEDLVQGVLDEVSGKRDK